MRINFCTLLFIFLIGWIQWFKDFFEGVTCAFPRKYLEKGIEKCKLILYNKGKAKRKSSLVQRAASPMRQMVRINLYLNSS